MRRGGRCRSGRIMLYPERSVFPPWGGCDTVSNKEKSPPPDLHLEENPPVGAQSLAQRRESVISWEDRAEDAVAASMRDLKGNIGEP